ncbi:MAG: tetratricopeptide repeat protein [Fimbriimonadaceae bacterium]
MKIAVLPLNAAEGTPPALGRQFSNFACDTLRAATEADVNAVSFLAQLEGQDGGRAKFVNVSDQLFDAEWITQFFSEAQTDKVMDGLIKQTGDDFDLTIRFHERDKPEPASAKDYHFTSADIFKVLHSLVKDLAAQAEATLPEELAGEAMDFGTDNPQAFIKFLEGYDALMYINQAQGLVAHDFSPLPAFQSLLDACDLDKDFLGPYETCVQLCRACVHYRLGTFEAIEAALEKLQIIAPDDFRAFFALAEAYQAVNNMSKAADFYEKALKIDETEPGIYSRLGMTQIALGMPVNAERNFRKAVELEEDDKPSMDLLANVLVQTGRAHEVPALWKELVDKNPQNAQSQAKHAISLLQAGREDEAIKAFENALTAIEDNAIIKRFYAPVLAQKDELDRAMDFYEDVIDIAPNDVQLLLEYAQTLQKAERAFEIPKVLKDVLASNPDPNTKAQTQAWLIELEQPQRVKAVEAAREKMEKGDYEGAVRDIKPLRNWLADYWKLWAILSSAYNHLDQFEAAEDASKRLLELFPGCEPAYGELVQAMTGLGKGEEAYAIMRMAAGQMPQSLGVHVNLALAAKRAGHKDEARALAKQIREAVGTAHQELDPVLAEIEA